MTDPKHDRDPKQEREWRPPSDRDPTGDPNRCGYYGIRRSDGQLCVGPVIAGTQRCRMHAGVPPEVARAQGQINLEVRRWMLDGHSADDVRPGETLLRLIAFWAFKVNEIGRMLGEAVMAAERLREAHAAQGLVVAAPVGDEEPDGDGSEPPAVQAARLDLERIFTSGGVAALVGYRYDADRSGRLYAAEEGIRGLARLEGEYNDRLARYCGLAVTARVAEAQVELAKRQGAAMFEIFYAVLRDLELTEDQLAAVPALLLRHVQAVVPGAGAGWAIEGSLVGGAR